MLRQDVEKLIGGSPLSENYKKLWMEALDFLNQSELELMKDVLTKLPYSDVVEFSQLLEKKVAQYQAEEDKEWEKLIQDNKN
ncbi:MAG: hypothetical protein WC764_02135 [Candidatus Paceibacterota bacterium]|jgi:hypothetical protein